jgi:hypothetical protein
LQLNTRFRFLTESQHAPKLTMIGKSMRDHQQCVRWTDFQGLNQ